MHAVFILYGDKMWQDVFLRDLQSQKLTMRYWKEDKPDQHVWVTCQLRQLPFGLYEFIFPKEHAAKVLTSLEFHKKPYPTEYDFNKKIFGLSPMKALRDFLKIKEIPEFDTKDELIWIKKFVAIVPVGVKYDREEVTEEAGEFAGWKHEGI